MRAPNRTGNAPRRIQTLTVRRNGVLLADVRPGPNVAENPLFTFAVDDLEPGDQVDAFWRDADGKTGEAALIAN